MSGAGPFAPTVGDEVAAQPSGFVLWFAVLGGIGAWLVHLIAEASLVELGRSHPSVAWTMRGLTGGLAIVTAIAIWLSWRIWTGARADEEDGTPAGRTAFLGLLGLITGITNLVLILAEDAYVWAIAGHA
jgi:hypothetical protein